VFHADFTGEYISHSLRSFLVVKGTLSQFSCPGAHAQNGVAERKHRHLLEMACALMIAASLPPHFWAKTISTTTYLINIQSSTALQGGIPLKRLSGHPPDYLALCLFGCVCYVLLAPPKCTQLSAQSAECVLRAIGVGTPLAIGYPFLAMSLLMSCIPSTHALHIGLLDGYTTLSSY
jgi:hypothetical protein